MTEEQAVLRSQVREEQEKKRKEEVAARDAENAKHQEELRARRMANSPRVIYLQLSSAIHMIFTLGSESFRRV